MKKKIVQSGDIIEIYEYSKGYLKDYENTRADSGRKIDYESTDYDKHRKQVLQRAKRDLRRLVNSNHGQYGSQFTSKFLTLTFGENVTDLDVANYEFKKFILRLNYLVFNTKKSNLKYNVVIEFQERGAIHYHIIIYNMPFIKQKQVLELWGNGIVWINKIDDIGNVGAYVADYLGDEDKEQGHNVEDSRLKGRKSYFSSRGLYKPIEFTDEKTVETVGTALPSRNLTHSAQFENEHLGHISYRQYNLKLK